MERRLIDVSEFNGTIDWEAVKETEIEGVIIRCGYGNDIVSQDDVKWKYNADECTRLGIPFGVYLYSYATTDAQSRSEAAHVLRLIRDYRLSYPVYLDLEQVGTENHAIAGARIFGNLIENAGYFVGVYANQYWFTTVIGSALDQYTKWCAKYSLIRPSAGGGESAAVEAPCDHRCLYGGPVFYQRHQGVCGGEYDVRPCRCEIGDHRQVCTKVQHDFLPQHIGC